MSVANDSPPKGLTIPAPFREGPVVLVSRPVEFTFPLSYAYLAGYLRDNGQPVEMIFRNGHNSDLVNTIMRLNPLIVGFGNLYPELKEVKEIVALLDKAGRKFPVVIGGQMVTPTPEFAVRITNSDFGVVGEGEIILHDLVRALRKGEDVSKIRGLIIQAGGRIVNTGPGPALHDLSCLPPIPYDLFPESEWLPVGKWFARNGPQPHWRYHDRVINVHGGRGCPFTCNFCYHHSKPRYRDITVMMNEANEALKRFNGNFLYFSDDLAMVNSKRASELVEGIKKLDRPIEYSVSARFDGLAKISDSLLGELKATGLRIVGIGLESGSDRILKVIGKKTSNAMIREGFTRMKEFGILPTTNIMVGQYSETEEDVEMSIQLVRDTIRENPNINYAFSICTPFPGSELYDLIFKEGRLKSDEEFYESYFTPNEFGDWNQVVNFSAMSDQKVREMFFKIRGVYQEELKKALGSQYALLRFMHRSAMFINRKIFNDVMHALPEKGGTGLIRRSYEVILEKYFLLHEEALLRVRKCKPARVR